MSAECAHTRHNRWFYFNYNFIVCVLRSLCGCRSLFHCALQSVLMVRVSNDMLIVVFCWPFFSSLFISLNQLFIWPIEGGLLMQDSCFQFSCWKKWRNKNKKLNTHNSTEILFWDKAENTCLIFFPSFHLVFFFLAAICCSYCSFLDNEISLLLEFVLMWSRYAIDER